MTKVIKVGVIGVGVMGERHCRVYSNLRHVRLVGVADQRAELHARHGHERHHGVSQGVPEMDQPLGQPSRAGEANEILPHNVEHLGTHEPHEERELIQRERASGENEGAPAARREQSGLPEAELHGVAAA